MPQTKTPSNNYTTNLHAPPAGTWRDTQCNALGLDVRPDGTCYYVVFRTDGSTLVLAHVSHLDLFDARRIADWLQTQAQEGGQHA